MKLFAASLALSGVTLASASAVTPVEKVISLIEELQSKVVEEGKAEAATYDTFACFCKDTSAAKSKSINDLDTQIEGLNADLAEETKNRNEADAEMAKQQEEIQKLSEERAKVEADGKKRREKYGIEITDMTGAVEALEGAIDVLKASDTQGMRTAFTQVSKTLEAASLMAQALNLKGSQKMARALLQTQSLSQENIPDVPVSDYDFHSNSIIDTLKELLVEFRKTKEQVDADEVAAVQEETKILQGLHDSTEAAKKAFEDAKTASGAADEAVGKISGDLTISTATLRDDQNYLVDLTDKCNKKKTLWDQRSGMRTDELAALTQALVLLKGSVSEKTTESTIRDNNDKKDTRSFDEKIASFVQIKAHNSNGKNVHSHSRNPLRMLSVAQKLRLESKNGMKSFMAARSPRDLVLNLLKAKSVSLKSAVLASVAAKVASGADPLAKVKKLIEELVLRLQQEASDEEAHNGWCVKQTKLAEDKRDTNAGKVAAMNDALAKGEANRDKLTENIAKLTKEKEDLEADLKKAKAIRSDEEAENTNTIADAKAGQEAVEGAIKIISQFYGTAKNEVASQKEFEQFLQKQGPVAEDMPDAGFDEEYGADQDTSGGILGMLDVIKSDFVRTIETTEETEKTQAADFMEFSTTTESSIAEKKSSIGQYDSELLEQKEEIQTNTDTMDASLKALDMAVTELEELHAACVDTGMSYEERVARREQEIEALKDAYKILDEYKL